MPKVLVVDHGGTARDAFGPLFERVGLEAVYVPSSPAALEAFEREPFDLVVSELRLPVMDGLVLTRKLRRLDPDALVILLAAMERDTDLLTAIKVGVFDFFRKPFDVTEFNACLERAVAQRERLRRPVVDDLSKAVPTPEQVVNLQARLIALEEREIAVEERERALERAVGEFDGFSLDAFDDPAPAPAARPAPAAPAAAAAFGGADELEALAAELQARQAAIEEREALMTEREAFLEASENALFEKGQRLQEFETELDHRAEGMGAPPAAARGGVPAAESAALAEAQALLSEREAEFERRWGALLERERRLKKNEALVAAREAFLRQSEDILFKNEE